MSVPGHRLKPTYSDLGNLIRTIRKNGAMTQKQLEDELCMGHGRLTIIERSVAKGKMTNDEWDRFCKLFAIDERTKNHFIDNGWFTESRLSDRSKFDKMTVGELVKYILLKKNLRADWVSTEMNELNYLVGAVSSMNQPFISEKQLNKFIQVVFGPIDQPMYFSDIALINALLKANTLYEVHARDMGKTLTDCEKTIADIFTLHRDKIQPNVYAWRALSMHEFGRVFFQSRSRLTPCCAPPPSGALL